MNLRKIAQMKFLKYILFFSFSFSIISEIYSQEVFYKEITTKNGLPSNEVYHVLQDSKGYIWFATNYGVSRYDGYNFVNYNTDNGLLDNTITEIYEDFEGKIWFISLTCKFCYYYNNRIYQYKFNEKLHKEFTQNIHPVKKSFRIDKNKNLSFCLHREGMFNVDSMGNVNTRNENKSSSVILLENDSSSRVLPIYRQNFFSDPHFIELEIYGTKSKTEIKNLISIFSQSMGVYNNYDTIYYFFENQLYILKGAKILRTIVFKTRIIWVNYDIKNSLLFIGTAGEGLFVYRNFFERKPYLNLFKDDIVTSVFTDFQNNIWVTSYLNGVKCIPEINLQKINATASKIKNIVNGINGDIWISDGKNEIYYISDSIITVLNLKKDSKREIHKLKYIKNLNSLYVCSNIQLIKVENLKIVEKQFVFPQPYYAKPVKKNICVYDIDEISKDSVALSVSGGIVSCLENDFTFQTWDKKKKWTKSNSIIFDKNKRLLLATEQGLKIYKNDSIFDYPLNYPEIEERMSTINVDFANNDIWLGTKGKGLILLHDDSIKLFTTRDGLCSNYIKNIYIDNSEIWLSSENGISKIEKTKEDFKITNFTTIQGFPTEQVYGLVSVDNYMYAATDIGLVKFEKNLIYKKNVNPKPYFTNVLINNRDTAILDFFELAHNQDFLTINFSSFYYKDPSQVKYKYALLGQDKKWNYSKNNNVQYTNLHPGDYTFVVYAYTEKIEKKSPKISIKFHIRKPFYNTWWFYISAFLFITSVLLLIYLFRINEIRKKNNLKMDLLKLRYLSLGQQMKPHFIFNTLNSIGYYIFNNNPESSLNYISKFSSLMRKILDNSSSQHISLKEEIDAIKLYIELECYRFSGRLKYKLDLDYELDMERTYIPTFLIQPHVENAIWHGLMHKEGEGLLKISIKEYEKSIICIIEDDGIGREKSAEINSKAKVKKESKATKITTNRANIINTLYKKNIKIDIIDLFNDNGSATGTKVIIEFPNNFKLEKNDEIINR